MTSSSRPAAAARSSSAPPARARAAPGPTPASLMSRPASSTAPTAPSASSPSRPSWSPCSVTTSATMAPRRTGGCSAAPAAACSASRSTAASGTARRAALGPDLAATALARRPYDLRHAALSLWLNASGAPAEVAARAGNSARVLHEVYLHCTDGHEDTVSQRIEDALGADASVASSSQCAKASGYTHRRPHPRPCPLSVREPVPGPTHSPRPPGPASPQYRAQVSAACSVSADQTASEAISAEAGRCLDPAHA